MLVALLGNQNSGKTTLFNCLTHSSQKVGNFPGVTIEAKKSFLKDGIEVVDLPGTYSLSHLSKDEEVSNNFIVENDIDLIINVVDATSLQRSLFLSCELMELGKPFIIALNMMDELKKSDNDIDIQKLSMYFGTDVIPISASKNENIDTLKEIIVKNHNNFTKKKTPYYYDEKRMKLLKKIYFNFEQKGISIKNYNDFVKNLKKYELDEKFKKDIAEFKDGEEDWKTRCTKDRYQFINSFINNVYRKYPFKTKEQKRSEKIDKIVLNKFLGYPLFILVMFFVFFITFGPIGSTINRTFKNLLDYFGESLNYLLQQLHISELLRSLINDGVVVGLGSVISFLPTILLLFFLLSLLEDSGYMTRIAIMMDYPFKKLNLSGKSFVPFLLGFGCSVPAVMATRTLEKENERKRIIYTTPFMSCSAKIPIYFMICSIFFKEKVFLLVIALYLLGIFLALSILSFSKGKKNTTSFLMELPPYRLPTLKNTFILMKNKAQDFIKKAFTIIFISSLVIWFLKSFNMNLNYTSNIENSLLAHLSRFISIIFKPLGFSDWRITASLLAGLSAKEAFVSTLGILFGTLEEATVILKSLLSPIAAFSLMTFVLLYTPCIATIATVGQELKSKRKAIFYGFLQTVFAWIISLIVYQIGVLL